MREEGGGEEERGWREGGRGEGEGRDSGEERASVLAFLSDMGLTKLLTRQ